jgi:hypothetical protein
LFFYDPKTINRIFLKGKAYYEEISVETPKYASYFTPLLCVYFIIQVSLPLRHWFIQGDVLRTEEGHRLSWRMMLRTKSGVVNYKVVNKETGETTFIDHRKMVSPKQKHLVATKPDVMWQFVQHLKQQYLEGRKEVEIYIVNSKVSINGKPYVPYINPEIDMATVSWNTFKHADWILEEDGEDEKAKPQKNIKI